MSNINNIDYICEVGQSYLWENKMPGLSKEELLQGMIDSVTVLIREHEKEKKKFDPQFLDSTQYGDSVTFLISLSAFACALLKKDEGFTKVNSGIPWIPISRLIRYIIENVANQEVSFGLCSYTLPSKFPFLNKEDLYKHSFKCVIESICADMEPLRESLRRIKDCDDYVQRFPVGIKIKELHLFYVSEPFFDFIKKMKEKKLITDDLSTKENRIVLIGHLSVMGEFNVLLKSGIGPTTISQVQENNGFFADCSKFRLYASHYEVLWRNCSHDDRIRKYVKELYEFVNNGGDVPDIVEKLLRQKDQVFQKEYNITLDDLSKSMRSSPSYDFFYEDLWSDATKQSLNPEKIINAIQYLHHIDTDTNFEDRKKAIEEQLRKAIEEQLRKAIEEQLRKKAIEEQLFGKFNETIFFFEPLGVINKGSAKLKNRCIYFKLFRTKYQKVESGALSREEKDRFKLQYESVKISKTNNTGQQKSKRVPQPNQRKESEEAHELLKALINANDYAFEYNIKCIKNVANVPKHQICRDHYQACAGDCVRALEGNPIFMIYVSTSVFDVLDRYGKVARGYLRHNAVLCLGTGENKRINSANIACQGIDEMKRIEVKLKELLYDISELCWNEYMSERQSLEA